MSALLSNAVILILVLPLLTAAILVLLPGYRLSAGLNVVSAFLTLFAAL